MEKKKGKNLKFLRENNTREVLKHLALNGDSSRIKLSKELGLSKMTITNIVNDLQSSGYVYESDVCDRENMGSTGPKPIMLRVKQNRLMSIGIYLTREKLICALSDIASGEIFVDQREFGPNGTREGYISIIIAMVEKVLNYDNELNGKVLGIGVACSGYVQTDTGVLLPDRSWEEPIPLKEILEERFPYKVYIADDVYSATVGEQLYGFGKISKNYMYIAISEKIRMSIVNNGRIMNDESGFIAELGHVSVDPNGPECQCGGHGCLNGYASIPSLLKAGGAKTMDELMELCLGEDQTAQKCMEKFISSFTMILSNLTKIFDVDYIIFGHEGSMISKGILNKIQSNLNNTYYEHKKNDWIIVTSTFGTLAGLRGATSLVFERFFEGEIDWTY